MWQSLEIMKVFITFMKVFSTLTLKQIFWKTQKLLEKLVYSFSVESARIENALFPYKTALSQRTDLPNYYIFSKILFQFKKLV